MALKRNENKVKFGLKRVAFAIATIAEDGSATYGEPITFPGARTLSMEPQGAGEPWYADDGMYYFSSASTSRQGDLEMARVIDAFKRQVLGYIADAKGLLLEDMNPETVHFALLFETMNDKNPVRYVMYNCVATAPNVGSATNEGSKKPQTETSTITSSGIYVASHGKWFDHGETTPKTDPEAFADWFNAVQLPGPPPDPYPVKTVTGPAVAIADAAGMAIEAMSVAVKPIQSGSGTPSPISGWTEAIITRCGKNLIDPAELSETSNGYVWGYQGTGFLFKGGVSYTLSTAINVSSMRIVSVDEETILAQAANNSHELTFTPAEDVQGVIRLWNANLTIATAMPQLEIGAAASEYEAGTSPTIYEISFPSEAGTVYGGTVDLSMGILNACPYYASYNGETLVGPWVSSMEAYEPGTTPTIGAQVVDLGGESQPYQLTQADVRTLSGYNVFFADCGDVTVSYHSDPSFDDE